MDNLPETKPTRQIFFVLLGIAIVVLAVVGIYYWVQKNKSGGRTALSPASSQPSVVSGSSTIRHLPVNEPLGSFLGNIPVERENPLLNTSQIIGNKEKVTYRFVSKKSPEENFEIYKKYLTDNKYTITNTVNQSDLKSLSAKNRFVSIDITMSINKQTMRSIVEITIVGLAIIHK
jgi:hypothetical protein